MKSGDIEVIVVPNGPDESWRKPLQTYKNNGDVRVIPLREANANVSRNAGLTAARGEFVRFLDDDDYLIPHGAVNQYELIRSSGVDVVSGSVFLADDDGRCYNVWHQPDTDDLCTAMLGPWRMCQPTAHVFRRSSLKNLGWNPATKVHQDYEWFFDLCASREFSWQKISDIVGVYWKHRRPRLSTTAKYNSLRFKAIVPMLERTYWQLHETQRLNEHRNRAVSQGLWQCVHRVFFLEPKYWSNVAMLARAIDRNAKPTMPIYSYRLIKRLNPLMIQWMLFPKRWLFYHVRLLRNKYWYWRYENEKRLRPFFF